MYNETRGLVNKAVRLPHMPNKKYARKIYRLHLDIVEELNDSHIFLDQACNVLEEAKRGLASTKSEVDREYYVPSKTRSKVAKRTDVELKKIYNNHLAHGLYEAFLTNNLSLFESYLADILFEYFRYYPLQVNKKVPNCPSAPQLSAKDLIESADLDDAIHFLIDGHLNSVFRQRPEQYIRYICDLLGLRKDASFADYYEIAATRDLLVHNSLVVNHLYLDKAKKKARGQYGEQIEIDKKYFSSAIAVMKRVSGAIYREVNKKYGEGKSKI